MTTLWVIFFITLLVGLMLSHKPTRALILSLLEMILSLLGILLALVLYVISVVLSILLALLPFILAIAILIFFFHWGITGHPGFH